MKKALLLDAELVIDAWDITLNCYQCKIQSSRSEIKIHKKIEIQLKKYTSEIYYPQKYQPQETDFQQMSLAITLRVV